ncbi:MAG TPA: hypothetical protein VFK90_11860 [Anaeromyxobacter sp.]|nr:hypothetical protein [Anaeromyxobacter sp.]
MTASAPPARAPGRPVPLPLLAAAAALAALAATLVEIDDPDTFHHLALGREIALHGLPTAEPFLYPLRGAATMPPPSWLGSLGIYGFVALLGERALAFFPALVAAAIVVVLLLDALQRTRPPTWAAAAGAALPIALAVETMRYRVAARPEMLAVLFLALTMWGLRRLEEGRPRLLLAFPALALLWGNVHPSTLAGIVPIAVFAACGAAAILASRALRRPLPFAPPPRQVAIAAAVAAAGLAASFANPSPSNPVLEAARFALSALRLGEGGGAGGGVALESVTRFVDEMQGAGWLVWTSPAGALIALAALSFALRWRAPRPRELVTAALFAWLPFGAVRFALLFAVVAAPIAARNLADALQELPERARGLPLRATAAAALAALAVASAPLGMQAPHIRFGTGLVPGAFPVRGADYLAAIPFDGRVFNTFHLGGYLEWRRAAYPYQDGRGGVPPGEADAAFMGPANPVTFAALDAKYRFDAVLLTVPTMSPGFAQALAASGRTDDWVLDRRMWSLVAFDDGGLLYLRRGGRYAALAARDEYRVAVPASPSALPVSDLRGAIAEYRRSLAEVPTCLRCRRALAELLQSSEGAR